MLKVFKISGGTILVLLIIELVFRVHHYKSILQPKESFIFDHYSGYTYNPKELGYSGGFRGGPPPLNKEKNNKTIICLGESITSGDFIPNQDQTWPSILQNKLNSISSLKQVNVFNLAVGGYGTKHILGLVKNRITIFRPDIVIIYAGVNGTGLINDNLWVPFPVISPADSLTTILDKFLFHYCTIYRSWIRAKLQSHFKYFSNKFKTDGPGIRKISYAGVPEDIAKIVDICLNSGSMPIVILFPLWRERGIQNRGKEFIDSLSNTISKIGELAKIHHAMIFDMKNLFINNQDEYPRFFLDYCHLTAEGCQWFSKALSDSIIANGKI